METYRLIMTTNSNVNDQLIVGVNMPSRYTNWVKTGSTKETGWPSHVDMTFSFDFSGVPLEEVFELAVSALVIDARPALKRAGYDFCKSNRDVKIKVAERKKRAHAQPSLISQLVASAKRGTLAQELKNVPSEILQAYLKAAEELVKSSNTETSESSEKPKNR